MTILSLSSTPLLPRAKSKVAQIAELLPEIEAALEAGHSHLTIFEHVRKTVGIDLTFGYYENTIHRVRRRLQTTSGENPTPAPAVQKISPKVLTGPHAMNVQAPGSPKSKLQQVLNEPIGDFFS